MPDPIYTPELVNAMETTYRGINTDLMVVVQSLIGSDILRTPQLEKRIKTHIENKPSWDFSTSDIGKACNKLFKLGILERYSKERNGTEEYIGEYHYCYAFSKETFSRERIIAAAALNVFGNTDGSIVELTQSKISINTIKLLIAMFPCSVLDMGPIDFENYRKGFKPEDYGPEYSDLERKTGILEKTLRRQLSNLEEEGYIRKVERPRKYRVVKDFSSYKRGVGLGSTERVLAELAKKGELTIEGVLKSFTVSSLYEKFPKRPNRKMLGRKIGKLVEEGYFVVENDPEPSYWELKLKGAIMGLYFVVPLQRYLMGYADLSMLKQEANFLDMNPLDLRRRITNILSRYAEVSGHVGKQRITKD